LMCSERRLPAVCLATGRALKPVDPNTFISQRMRRKMKLSTS